METIYFPSHKQKQIKLHSKTRRTNLISTETASCLLLDTELVAKTQGQ
jgi:hypothetical protein